MTIVLALVVGIVIGVLLTVLFEDNWAEASDPRQEVVHSRAEINAIRHEAIRQMKAASREGDLAKPTGRTRHRP